jgi:DNA-binding transcriptional ArsR family regulator
MALICCRELCVSDVVEELGNISQPTVSHHLQILRTAGLVDTRRDGKQVYYTLRQAAIANCCRVISHRFAPLINAAAPESNDGASETQRTDLENAVSA